jgi:hypothetical protein
VLAQDAWDSALCRDRRVKAAAEGRVDLGLLYRDLFSRVRLLVWLQAPLLYLFHDSVPRLVQ